MRGSGRYGNSGGNAHPSAHMQHMSGQRMEQKPANYHGRPEPLASDKDHSYGASKAEGQWRWEREGSKAPTAMSSRMFNEGQRGDEPRSYYQGQRADPKMGLEKQGNDPLSKPRREDMDVAYDDNPLSQTFDGLEKKYLDEMMKLSKEQTDAEDAEITRHRERINSINVRYQEQLGALRARYANRRDEFLRKESQERQKQYEQAMVDSYTNSGVGPNDPHGYVNEPPRGNYNANQYDADRERARFLGSNARDPGYDQRGPYLGGGRVYDTGSRYY